MEALEAYGDIMEFARTDLQILYQQQTGTLQSYHQPSSTRTIDDAPFYRLCLAANHLTTQYPTVLLANMLQLIRTPRRTYQHFQNDLDRSS